MFQDGSRMTLVNVSGLSISTLDDRNMSAVLLRNSPRSASNVLHTARKCCLVSGSSSHNLHCGLTLYWLKTALFPWRLYVPVSSLHFSWAIRLSWMLSRTVFHIGCGLPICRASGLMYLREGFVATSSRHALLTVL